MFILKKVEKANTRQGGNHGTAKKGQNFKVRFRKYKSEKSGPETRYYISDAIWDKLNLEVNGLNYLVIRETETSPVLKIWFEVVSAEDATLLRKNRKNENGKKKGRNFKATVLDGFLAELGIISLEEEVLGKNQLLNFVETSYEGKTYYEIAKDVEGQKSNDAEEAAVATEGTTSSAPAPAIAESDDDNDL